MTRRSRTESTVNELPRKRHKIVLLAKNVRSHEHTATPAPKPVDYNMTIRADNQLDEAEPTYREITDFDEEEEEEEDNHDENDYCDNNEDIEGDDSSSYM